jgi:hypothetical protein
MDVLTKHAGMAVPVRNTHQQAIGFSFWYPRSLIAVFRRLSISVISLSAWSQAPRLFFLLSFLKLPYFSLAIIVFFRYASSFFVLRSFFFFEKCAKVTPHPVVGERHTAF